MSKVRVLVGTRKGAFVLKAKTRLYHGYNLLDQHPSLRIHIMAYDPRRAQVPRTGRQDRCPC